MGCKQTSLHSITPMADVGTTEVVFGSGVHVGRSGNADLSGRQMEFLGTNIVNMINKDELRRTATSLTLSENKLYTLGKEMLLLESLQEIDLDHNKFQRLPEILTNLQHLWRINLGHNPLNVTNGLLTAPRVVSLRSLNIQDCNLQQFPRSILECTNLEELDISNNAEIKLVGINFAPLVKLQRLNIAHCGQSGTLPSGIRNLRSLRSLDLSENTFDFEDPNFFGKNIPGTLTSLSLRHLDLHAVPQVVVTLKKLNELDLAHNPIETLDVLAGRLVKRPQRSGSVGGGGPSNPSSSHPPAPNIIPEQTEGDKSPPPAEADDNSSNVSDGRASTASRVSMSKASKAGVIAHVSQPIPLKKLSLRACDLRTVPKYFHKMSQLEELDLSENERLDDPNMTLFSLQNLRVLNIIGCPFADNPGMSRNEWFDIAKLRNLQDIQWELWKGYHNMSPYRTKIPLEVCNLPLKRVNLITLRNGLFVGETTETVINILHDGYFKVDLAIDDSNLFSYLEAVHLLLGGEKFFFPKDVPPKTNATSAAAPLIKGNVLGDIYLRIAINRYIFFLAMQAANYDAVILPPVDVMIIHYSQITINPAKYRADCEAICGRILNCNYRSFFVEQHRHGAAAKDAIAASRRIWNLMVRSAQKELTWLRYDFWDKRARATDEEVQAAASAAASAPADAPPRMQSLPPQPVGQTDEEILADFQSLQAIDSSRDLHGVLDQAITAHFTEQGDDAFRKPLREFFDVTSCFVEHESALHELTLDWTRYVKYVALYASRVKIRKGSEDSAVVMEPVADADGNLFTPNNVKKRNSSILGPHYDSLMSGNYSFHSPDAYLPQPNAQAAAAAPRGAPQRSASGIVRRPTSMLSTTSKLAKNRINRIVEAMQNFTVDPIPTVGLTLLLHVHRTSHVKYYQMLSLFEIETTDISWSKTNDVVEQTKRAWEALYEESYVGNTQSYPFHCEDGMLVTKKREKPSDSAAGADQAGAQQGKTNKGALKPAIGAASHGNRKHLHVTLCGGDTQAGVF